MLQGRAVAILWVSVVSALAGWACESSRSPGGFQPDLVPPTIILNSPKAQPAIDTQQIANGMSFTVGATDNLALNDISLVFAGGLIDTTDTVFYNQTLKSVTLPVHLVFPANSGAGGLIQIIGRATDGAGNFAEDTIFIFLNNVQALRVFLLSPGTGAVASTGRSIPIEVVAQQLSGIRKVGFIVAPAAATTNPTIPPDDSISYTIPYPDSVDYVDTVDVVATTGTFTITGFAEDSSGRRSTSATVVVSVLSAANDVTPPSVTDSVGTRIEVSDTVKVTATDPSAISQIGFRVRLASDSSVLMFVTVPVGGNLTAVVRRFTLNLGALTSFPTTVLIDGYACDAAVAVNCAFSTVNGIVGGTARADSAQVVAGVSRGFPQGGKIADAIFNATRGELYLTNTPLSRVEVFQVANSSFVASGIPTAGPQPFGIALWPRDTLGNYGDSIVVADAGGTEFSVIDVAARRLRWRQDLPNYEIEKYTGGSDRRRLLCRPHSHPRPVGPAAVPCHGVPHRLRAAAVPRGLDIRRLLDDADGELELAVQRPRHTADGEADQHEPADVPGGQQQAVRAFLLGNRRPGGERHHGHAAHPDAPRAALQRHAGHSVGVRRGHDQLRNVRDG